MTVATEEVAVAAAEAVVVDAAAGEDVAEEAVVDAAVDGATVPQL